jgi:ubiquitin carboxyl-terminal hydrolase 7
LRNYFEEKFILILNAKVNYSTSKIEDFYDLSLNVKGCNGLIDSFKKYCETEILEGENKYNAGNFGLQCY